MSVAPAPLAAPPVPAPRLRGVLHLVAFIAFIPLALVLQALTTGAVEPVATTVYATGVLAMLGVSAVYHRGRWAETTKRRLRRLDHSAIVVAIAATYTPVCVLGLGPAVGIPILVAVWVGAAAGIAVRLLWLDAPRWLTVAVYAALGWVAVGALPALGRQLSGAVFALVLAGGLIYTAGAVVYACRRPDPSPTVFGFHEVFHALVVVAALCHYAAVVTLVVTT